jgi:CHAT domain-containing protein
LDFLRLPLEFLSDGSEFLALKHPIRRLFSGVYTSRPSFSSDELRKFQGGKNKLKILLVASNTGGIPGVDREISSLDRVLRELLASQGIASEITTIFSDQSCIERIRDELAQGKYNIFHYAGHGSFNQKPENSSLFFWEDESCSGKPVPMTANELGILSRDTTLQFIYLSCCTSAQTADATVHLDDNFMGITDALIKAGIPSVLGFRWPVSDIGALSLAKEFYKSFCLRGELDTALLDARQKVAKIDRTDSAWLSPVLVVQ